MNDVDKLRVLLPHWIEHNEEHAAEFVRWAETAQDAGRSEAAELIGLAAQNMAQVNRDLQSALTRLGGALKTHLHEH